MIKESTAPANAHALGSRLAGGDAAHASAGFFIGSVAPRNAVFLAPLSGITDVPFRRLARRLGAGLVVSEMVASGDLVKEYPESILRAMRDGEGTHVVQLAGRDPEWMRAATQRAVDSGADVVDINMGCPAKRVVGGMSGSALMREPDLALRLVEATVAGAGSVPVTLKMRLGWDHASINSPEIAARAESAGVRMITVHGRTRQQRYEGSADWHAIAAVKAAVGIPVVANGDLTDPADRARMLAASGANAVMVGRGACGRPWLPGLMAGEIGCADLSRLSFADLVTEHYEDMLDHYRLQTGIRHARKHLGWYLDRFVSATQCDAAKDRGTVLKATEPAVAIACLRALFQDASAADMEFDSPHASRQEAA